MANPKTISAITSAGQSEIDLCPPATLKSNTLPTSGGELLEVVVDRGCPVAVGVADGRDGLDGSMVGQLGKKIVNHDSFSDFGVISTPVVVVRRYW
jgi:hypothetical protein